MFGGMPPGAGHMKETDGCTGSFWYVRYRTRPSKEDKKRTHFVKQREGVRPCLRVWKTKPQPFTCAEAPKTSRAR